MTRPERNQTEAMRLDQPATAWRTRSALRTRATAARKDRPEMARPSLTASRRGFSENEIMTPRARFASFRGE
jgi:hypothetical protein